jgi:hypothetical protein
LKIGSLAAPGEKGASEEQRGRSRASASDKQRIQKGEREKALEHGSKDKKGEEFKGEIWSEFSFYGVLPE